MAIVLWLVLLEGLYLRALRVLCGRGVAVPVPQVVAWHGAMALWIAAIVGGLPLGGDYGAVAWHAHEMLFGFGSAVLSGFLMTAIPNWTGRMPLAGRPLVALASVWLAGRLAMLTGELASRRPLSGIDTPLTDGARKTFDVFTTIRDRPGDSPPDQVSPDVLTALSIAVRAQEVLRGV